MPSPSPFEAAQEYLSLGYWPTPLWPVSDADSDADKGKKFLWRNWIKKRPSVESLKEAYDREPKAGVGLLLGPDGGLVDVDVDDEEKAGPGLKRLFGDVIPATAGWRSAKGFHLLFRWEADLEEAGAYSAVRQNHPLYQGIDLRIGGRGKTVAATVPPTEGRDRKPKVWFRGIEEIQSLDARALALLVEDLKPPPRKEYSAPVEAPDWESRERRALKWMDKSRRSISGAGGSPSIWFVGCHLKGFSLDTSELIYLLSIYNQSAEPPWSDKDIVRTAERIAQKSKEPFGFKLKEKSTPQRSRRSAVATPNPRSEPEKAEPKVEIKLEKGPEPTPGLDQVQIIVDFDEWRVNHEAQLALSRAENVFQRGGKLVSIVKENWSPPQINRPPNSPTIQPIRRPILREHLSRVAAWFWPSETKSGEKLTRIYPPDWSVAAIAERGEWKGIRHLEAIIESPTLRPDGSVLEKAGYDPETGIVLNPNARFEPIKKSPTIDDATRGLCDLMEPVSQFFWSNNESKSVWLSLVLTLVIRTAIAGPTPMVLIDASTRGSGKTLLANVASVISHGRVMATSSYTHNNPEELRKTLETTALCGDPVILYDNVTGWLGGQILEKQLTDWAISFRLLGTNEKAKDVPWRTQIVATGNNTRIKGDMDRRTLWVRLQSLLENPHHRSDIRIRKLLKFVELNRSRLHHAALTACRAFAVAGRPEQVSPLGGYDDWSEWIRNLLIWCGMPDPVDTQSHSKEIDEDAAWRNLLIRGWLELPFCAVPTRLRDVLAWLDRNPHLGASFREAIADVGRDGKKPDIRTLGNRFKQIRQRVIGEHLLDFSLDRDGIAQWRIYRPDGKPVVATVDPKAEQQFASF